MSNKRSQNDNNLNNKKIKKLNLELNDCFKESIDEISKLYKSNKEIKKEFNNASIDLIKSPFKTCLFSNFIKNDQFLDNLKDEINDKIEFFDKDNDLYKFKQSEDFKLLDYEYCNQITKWLRNDVLNYIKKITGIDLYDNQIDITASKYSFTDTLLCHDDHIEEEERRIAFILYLVDKDWNEEDGGHLDLISKDDNEQPTITEKSLLPKFNNFAFFEVSPSSFHQVREVLSSNKVRLSVNGWFKGPKVYKIKPFKEQFLLPITYNQYFVEEKLLKEWINNLYLTDEIENDVKTEFKNESQTMLLDFIDEEKFKKLENALKECKEWTLKGPANRRRFFILEEKNYPPILNEFLSIMKSEQFFLILGQLTGLKLHELNKDSQDDESEDDSDIDDNLNKSIKSDPRCKFEIRKFEKGCYTLIHDYNDDILDKKPKLDVKFYLNHYFEASPDSGGCTHYLEKASFKQYNFKIKLPEKKENEEEDIDDDEDDDDGELLTIEPINNALSIVYRDEHTVRFEKYLNCTHEDTFYELSMIFQE